MPPVPTRIRSAVETLDVSPNHRVLEIGGGPGVSASLVCAILARGNGSYLGIDRSPLATRRARERNAAHVASGRAEFRMQDIAGTPLPPAAFDRILAVNVNLFWTDPDGPALANLHRALRNDGLLVLVFEGTVSGTERLRGHQSILCEGLEQHQFSVERTRLHVNGPRPRLHIAARRAGA